MKNLMFLVALLGFTAPASANIDIQFDYRYDNGFFTGANVGRQTTLNAAALVFESRLQDTLAAITSTPTMGFNAMFYRPDTGALTTLSNFSVGSDKIIVFVGAHSLSGNALAMGGSGGVSLSGSPDSAFINNAYSRGEAGALTFPKTDFGPWGGDITFNSVSNWSAGGFDLLSVATHELAHVLGFGTSPSFAALVKNGVFTGPAATDAIGHSPTVASGHWSTNPEAAMAPSIYAGQHKQFTTLDFAAMKDIGWTVSPIPEVSTWAMMFAGLGLIGMIIRRKVS